MKKILLGLVGLAISMPVLANETSIRCANSAGSVRVDLTGAKAVKLLGKEVPVVNGEDANLAKTTFESETTDLSDGCFDFKISDLGDPVHKEAAPGGNTTSYYTVEFEMRQICRRTRTPAYEHLSRSEAGSIKELLLCREGE